MFSPSTQGVSKKIIKTKHHEELLQAYEIDPFHDKTLLREKATEEFRLSRNLQRKQTRVPVPAESNLSFRSDFGFAKIVDFSKGGISVALEKYLARNVAFTIKIDPHSSKIARELYDRGIDQLIMEVKWGKVENDRYLHGAKFTNMSEVQKEFLFHCLEDNLDELGATALVS